MSGDLEVVVDLGGGTKYAKHWNYAATSYTIKRSGKHLFFADKHETRLVEELLHLRAALAACEERCKRLVIANENAEKGFVNQLEHQREMVAALTAKLEKAQEEIAALRDRYSLSEWCRFAKPDGGGLETP